MHKAVQSFMTAPLFLPYFFTALRISVMNVSESTLYPVLRRLQKEDYLQTYDREFAGRNRRYYRITEKGLEQLEIYRREWTEYKKQIDSVMLGGISHE